MTHSLIDHLNQTFSDAMANRPAVGGFPFLAEALRRAGVVRNLWELPSCQSMYVTNRGTVINQGTPLVSGMVEVPNFDQDALIAVIRSDQAGHTTFPEFLQGAWSAGVVHYDVDFSARTVSYYGSLNEVYVEAYPEWR